MTEEEEEKPPEGQEAQEGESTTNWTGTTLPPSLIDAGGDQKDDEAGATDLAVAAMTESRREGEGKGRLTNSVLP